MWNFINGRLGEILSYEFLGNSVQDFVLAFLFFVALFVGFKGFEKVIVSRLKKLAEKTKNEFDDYLIEMLEKISWLFYFVVALYFPLKMLVMGETADKVVDAIFLVVVVYQIIRSVMDLVEYGLKRWAAKDGEEGEDAVAAYYGIKLLIKILLWVVGLLLIFSNLGVNVTSLVASLGIGGIAVALAAQNILGDLFSSFSIYFDKPFKVGDYIAVGEHSGNVKKIGLKTTRIQTLQGEELVISNEEITKSRVQNFKKLKNRRVNFGFGVKYETGLKNLRMVNRLVEDVIGSVEGVEFDRSHFKEFGEFSLNFDIVYYVMSRDYADYMDRQQEINFKLLEAFEKEGIEMAYPTQTVYLANGASDRS